MWATLLGLLAALAEPALTPAEGGSALEAALVDVESAGNPAATSVKGAVGTWQVMPSSARVPAEWLAVPAVSRGEGRRVFRSWLARCRRVTPAGQSVVRCGLRAYACGTRGLQPGWCEWYADKVLARMR